MSEHTVSPLAQTELFGHTALLKIWQEAYTQNKLHHGLLVTGPAGIGKATLAFHFLKWLFKQQSSQPQLVEKQMLAGSYPGLKIIERLFDEKRQRYAGEITLDAIAPIFDFLRLSVIDGGARAIVIDGADRMNRNAQNMILKLLEEPPPKTFFLLLVEQPGRLLPTIRSRCMNYTVERLTPAEFSTGLQTLAPDIDRIQQSALYALADGSLGQAVRWHQQNWLDLYQEILTAAASLTNGMASKPALKWAEIYALAAQETSYEVVQDLLLQRLGQIVVDLSQHRPPMPLLPTETPLLTHWQQRDSRDLLAAYDRLTHILRAGERSHLDRKLTLLQALQAFTAQTAPVASPLSAR